MADTALSRKDRRARIAKASKIYGIKGEESLDLHEAYRALSQNDVMRAVQLAHPITRSHPKSVHAWVVMGGAALAQREGDTAEAFFQRALDFAPNETSALVGLAKAQVLQVKPEDAVRVAARAFAAGADEKGLVNLYMELMRQMGRVQVATDVVIPVLKKLEDAELCMKLADMLTDIEETAKAAVWLDRAWRLDPEPEVYRIGRLRGLIYSRRLEQADELANALMADPATQDKDSVLLYKVLILRISNRPEEALALAEAHEFTSAERYAELRGIVANILQDIGRGEEAGDAYLEGMHVTGAKLKVSKAYGAFLMRGGNFEDGPAYFADRFETRQRSYIPYENASPENMRGLSQLYLIGEQGVGDQLALMSLFRLCPVDTAKTPVTLATEARFVKALEGNGLGVEVLDRKIFTSEPRVLAPNELVYIGDLTRYIDAGNRAAHQGSWVTPDAGRMQHLRDKYERLADGGPIIGAAWASGSMLGHLRSVSLMDILSCVPDGALVVNLQYGDCKAEIEAARRARPGVSILDDPEVDQMSDLATFFAQVAAMDRVLTIDNTTAHTCGAIGHPDTHVLIPTGSECMWYWGDAGDRDPWYGNLSLYRQTRLGVWDEPLTMMRNAVCP
ncbi:TPR domain protein [Pseudooceanicola batsensis HTCC2597]|uniref:TPR domain protein n=1 Tax=Pseudooceanicola batsensis (strain ATCC BAA-863 / DSM 15984 / KCTC 12145 / HTCC2597) TaxID=252305 RepID=A3U116_PSEBH|nr:tetratricopeptide repeat protein [Pseudooceanicola batsensis]EAQ01999.1 TPR domain protein [Pseudooceanicola batsensis HTCC2597]